MALQANKRNGDILVGRNERTMPKWVTEQTNRIGPRPPPPPSTPENGNVQNVQPNLPPKTKTQPEPDYEVIEFSNQQYSNAPIRPNSASSGSKTPDSKLKCTLCGSGNPWVTCDECAQQIFCASCDDMFHKHPKRKNHQRKTMDQSRPPLPPKVLPGQAGPSAPVAPPRRNKRGLMTPLMQRKDQGNSMPGPFPVPASPTPSMKNASWQERFGSLPRGLNIMNRPLPETPKSPSESSRSTTPKSVFDNIQRPPSVTLEKIKNKANATLDRMQILQQRYRQQKEQMERERSGSATDQWSNISHSPSHFPSGSMSSGINSSHLDLSDDTNLNLFHQRQMARQHHQMAAQRADQLGQRHMSNSVFNLNQMNRKQPQVNNGWMNNPMHQAQSMAQLNCANCHTQQQQSQWGGSHQHHMHTQAQDPWSNQLSSQQHFNRSNLSLNIGAGYMMQPQHNGMYPPPVFMNQRGLMQQMYPPPYMGGMPIMNPGLMGVPPATSRAASRAGSRMASPAMSRHSVTLRRKQRSGYIDDEATDDEDSDEDDRRSMASNRSGINRSRQRRLSSASQIQLDDEIDSSPAKSHRNRVRGQRRDSIAKSVHNDWAPGRRASTNNNTRSVDSGFNSPLKPSRIYSDLDSEGSGTRALVQAKIEQKLKEETIKRNQNQSKKQTKSQSPPVQKRSTAIQTPLMKQVQKQEKEPEKLQKLVTGSAEQANQPSASESEDEEGDEQETEGESEEDAKESATKIQEKETELTNNLVEETGIEDDDLGPPPSTPDHEWECEFCTFVNEANIKICTICCKTPCAKPKKAAISMSPPKQLSTSVANEDKAKDKSGTVIKKPSHTSTTRNDNHEPITNTQSAKINSAPKVEDKKDTTITNTLKKKESVEDIWATLDENIQATAHEVTRKAESEKTSKVSTACGTSSKSASTERQEVEIRKSQAREIGTSPPPHSISTQTYDTLPVRKPEVKDNFIVKTSQPSVNDTIQSTNVPSSPKIHDMKSFEDEVLNNIHNISHIPSHHQHHYQQQQHHRFANERQRYRSNIDLRRDDSMSMDFDSYNGLGRRQPSISELMLLQRTSSQMHSPLGGSIYDLPYRDMDNHKESDIYKHTTEELNAALKYCGPDMHPLIWLRDNWPKLIQTVQSLATKYGQERAENTIGTISQMEAREALRMHTGNIWQAVSECIEQRQRKYREISNKGNFSREDIVTALTTHQGNVEMALMDLGRTQLKPFLMRIWGSPGGVENESGTEAISSTLHSSPSTQYNMDKDIHNFLSANATECMQIPNATGAFPYNNQMPSPFDLPTSLSNSYENNNHMLDNTSSYSADSYAPSPFQLDDSILGNKSVLKDLETLIGNMEQNQQKQNEHVLRSINDMITNIKQDKPDNDYDTESMRILTKSPITSTKMKNSPKDNTAENEDDVKNFVWQHIQEIVPNLVQQVEMELLEDIADHQDPPIVETKDIKELTLEPVKQTPAPPPPPPPPPIDQDEFLMEEVIKPNIKTASFREELPTQYVYAAEIATFQMAFDKGLEREHAEEFDYDSIDEAIRKVFKMFIAPELQPQTLQSNVPSIEQVNKSMVKNNDSKEHQKDSTFSVMQSSIESQYNDADITEKTLPTTLTYAEMKIPIETQSLDITTLAETQPLTTTPEPSSTFNEMVSSTEAQYFDTTVIEDERSLTKSPENLLQQNGENIIAKPLKANKSNSSIPVLCGRKTPLPETPMLSNTTELQNTISHIESEKDIITKSSTSKNPESNKKDIDLKMNCKELIQYKGSKARDLSDEISSTSIKFPEPTNSQNEQSIIEDLKQISNLSDHSNDIIQHDVTIGNYTTLQAEFSVNPIVEASVNSIANQQTQLSEEVSAEGAIEPLEIESEIKTPHHTTKIDMQYNSSNSQVTQPQSELLAKEANHSNNEISSNEAISEIKMKSSSNVNISNNNQRKLSKIPVRRTASNISLASNTKPEHKQEITEQQKPIINKLNPELFVNADNSKDHITDDESEEEELLSMPSDTSETEIASRADQFQSPNSTSEIFLTIQHEGAETISTIAPSASSSTLHSVTSISSGLKSPTEFVPSGDPSKQNLSDLVKDTQRLIQQMKDEISIDDFESSTDDDDYTDEYTDEYDGEEEEGNEWYEEEEDDEEYNDLTEDITEENDIFSNEEDRISNANSPLPNEEFQDLRDTQNSSVLSNITESSDHSLSLLSDHIVQKESITNEVNATENNFNSVEDSMSYVEAENNSAELIVEHVIGMSEMKFVPSMAFIESESNISEMPVETVLTNLVDNTNISAQVQATTSLSTNVEELQNSIEQVETVNSSMEIPGESVIGMSQINLQPSAAFVESENNLSEMPVETVLMNVVDNTNIGAQAQSTTSLSAKLEELQNSLAQVEAVNSSVDIPAESVVGMSETMLEPATAFVEAENNLPEIPVEIVFNDHSESTNIILQPPVSTSSSVNVNEQQSTIVPAIANNFPATPLSTASELETEKQTSELPVETVLVSVAENMTLTKPATAANSIEPITTSTQTTTTKQSEDSKQSTSYLQTENSLSSTSKESVITPKTQLSPEQPKSHLRSEDDLPSTSKGTKKILLPQDKSLITGTNHKPKLEQRKSSLQTKNNLPSNGTKPKLDDSKRKSIDEKKPLATSKIPKPKEIAKDQKSKGTATPKPQNEFKKKITTRSKSFSGPPTPIGISSVKTISQRFINPIQNTAQAIQKNQSSGPRKSSITDAINKLTRPSTSSEGASTSALFRSRTQPRIPKKKYHETCFSDDDYETSSSEEEVETIEIRQRKFSVPVFRAYPSVQEPEEINTEELVNKFMKEELVPSIAQAQIAATLVTMKFQQDVSLWAAKECSDLDHAIALLKQECELCSGTYALNEIVSMLKCIHKCCKQCAKTYFTVQITERSINDCSCPFCKLPELHNQTEHEDEILEYFSNLDIFLKSILEAEVHELFQRKLRDRTLLKDPNFKWCVQCSSGFFARPKQKRLICPDCGSVTCAQCRKPWQKQHEGISCDQFLEWEEANDPEVQAIGVKQHLDQNGIDCPKCKFRYSLARGGCMHFTCTQCKYEFCYGCAKPFMMGAKCTISSYCAKLGLHAHHPRNCLFYLRDKLPVQLQILLKNNGITFEIDDPIEAAADQNEPSSSIKKEARCLIAIQKETPTGLVDTKCNGDVPEKHAGMCRTHYVEYLSAKVAKAHIDPLPIFDLTDCVQELRRRGLPLPERGPWDTDEIYKKMCAEVIQKNIPLDSA